MPAPALACSLMRQPTGSFVLRIYLGAEEVLREEYVDASVAAKRAGEACQQIARDGSPGPPAGSAR
jgi:hypothetical protein